MTSTTSRAVVSSAPMRITVAGGGTDLPEYYRHGPTAVVAVAIDRWVRVAVASTPEAARDHATLASGETRYAECVSEGDPNPYLVASRVLLGVGTDFHVAVSSHVRPGSGLGGSGAFCVALLDAIARFHGKSPSSRAIARLAFQLERGELTRPVGHQDFWAAAVGGAIRLRISEHGEVDVAGHPEMYQAMEANLHSGLLLFGIGAHRDAGRVLAGAREVTAAHREQALDAAGRAEVAFLSRSADTIGATLREHWSRKVRANPASDHPVCRRLEELSDDIGVHGFKIIGAGGGGHLMVAADPRRRAAVITRLTELGLSHEHIDPCPHGLLRDQHAGPVAAGTGGLRCE